MSEQMQPSTASKDRRVGRVGLVVLAIGVIHNLLGLLVGVGFGGGLSGAESVTPLLDIIAGGVIGAVEPDLMRTTWFWFVFFGWLLMIIGGMARHLEKRGQALPSWLGYQLVALAVTGGLMIPLSGFWSALLPAAMILMPNLGRSGRTASAASRSDAAHASSAAR